ncbi:MAG TPA: SDR family oxidoreductase, partial [Phycisphaerales bacterium]|nr:SDR family oxidoreductase [Phycisphaerales bacterium]
GYTLLLVGRRPDPLREAVAQLSRITRCVAHMADIGDTVQAIQAVDMAVGAFGRLDVIINNAGLAPLVSLDSVAGDLELLDQLYRVNAIGPTAIIGRAWSTLLKQQGGCIVNISSFSTVDPFPGLGVYGAAKAAVNVLARACHNEGRRFGIRAFAVAPGAVETAMLRSIFPEEALPRTRTLSPDTVAEVVVSCVRGERDAQLGETILVPSP